MSKDDFLKECMRDIGTTAIDEFSRNVCTRCINRTCGRSGANNMLFNLRAQNWKKDLFDQVPRGDEENSITTGPPKFIPLNEPKYSIVATSAHESSEKTCVDDNNESTKEVPINNSTETLPSETAPKVTYSPNFGTYNTPTQSHSIKQPTNSSSSTEVQEGNTFTFDDE